VTKQTHHCQGKSNCQRKGLKIKDLSDLTQEETTERVPVGKKETPERQKKSNLKKAAKRQ